MHWYLDVLRKYAEFNGRARRTEYWMYFLFNVIIACVLAFIDRMTGLVGQTSIGLGPLYGIYVLATLIPSVAVAVRRLHDTNRSGWWLLIALFPIIGGLVVLVLLCQDSQPGENQYGPSPKGVTA